MGPLQKTPPSRRARMPHRDGGGGLNRQFWNAPALQAPVRATPSKSTDGHHAATPSPRAGLPAVKWKLNPVAFTKSGSVFGMLPLMVRPVPRVCTASVETLFTSVAPFPAPSNQTPADVGWKKRSEEHTSELQSPCNLVCRLLLEKKKKVNSRPMSSNEPVYRASRVKQL